jgi:hypothetical protein
MKLITRRQHEAAIYEVIAYGRHDHVYKVTSRIEGLTPEQWPTQIVRKGIRNRDEAIQLAQDETDLSRIMSERGGIARTTAMIHLESERRNEVTHKAHRA